jgi:hypothetical protein
MKTEQVSALREFWKRQCTEWICYHPIVIGMRNEEGDLTGTYVCTRCGAEVFQGNGAELAQNSQPLR